MTAERTYSLAALVAFAEAIRDGYDCHDERDADTDDHVDRCWRCYAVQALEEKP